MYVCMYESSVQCASIKVVQNPSTKLYILHTKFHTFHFFKKKSEPKSKYIGYNIQFNLIQLHT